MTSNTSSSTPTSPSKASTGFGLLFVFLMLALGWFLLFKPAAEPSNVAVAQAATPPSSTVTPTTQPAPSASTPAVTASASEISAVAPIPQLKSANPSPVAKNTIPQVTEPLTATTQSAATSQPVINPTQPVKTATVAVKLEQPTKTMSTPSRPEQPLPPLPKMAELGTLYFKLGRHDLTSDDQHQLALFAKEPATQSAVKIHVRGFSGNSSVSYDERRTLAFSRAWSVKEALTTKHGIPLQKVRMFYISNDHMGKARVEMKRFDSVEAATKDVAQKP